MNTSCLDWEKRIVNKKSLISQPPLFPQEAEEAINIFNMLRVADVVGSPPFEDIARPWITDFVKSIFGAYDHSTGKRLITEFFLLISKKNGKSTTAAGIMLTALLLNWRESAEFLILAPTVEVANNAFAPIRDMIRLDDELSSLMQVQSHIRTITHRGTNATLKVVAADSDSVGGKKAVGVLVDELWLFGKRSNAENMLREATGGLASRPEGFVIYLSTQSDEAPAGIFKKKLDYARNVRDGKIKDSRFLPVLYEFPTAYIEQELYKKPENFYITNPNLGESSDLGASVDVEFLEREYEKAVLDGEESLCSFLAKHLNVEIGLNLRSNHWAGAEFWLQQINKKIDLNYIIETSEVVDIGIDGGGLDDLLGFYLIGRHKETRKWQGWARAWAHKSVLERRKSEAPKFLDFARDGDLVIVQNIGEDVKEIAEIALRIEEAGLLDKIGVDPHGLGAIVETLENAGIPEDKIIGISQGWKLTGAVKTAERKLAEGVFEHGQQPLMAWSVGNAKVVPAGNAVLITKQVSGTAKIDPVMAMLNAVSLMSLNPNPPSKVEDFLSNMLSV